MVAQLGLEVAFWAPGLRAAGRWAPGVEGQLPVLMDWWEVWGKGGQRSGREKGDSLPNQPPWRSYQGKRSFNTKPH